MIKICLFILSLVVLNGCVDSTTGRDVFGNVPPGGYATAEQIGENKYYVEAVFQRDAIRGAKETCANKGKKAEVLSIDNSGRKPIVTFKCY